MGKTNLGLDNDLPDRKLKCDENIIEISLKLYYYLFILLVYIERKFPLFIPSKDKILIKNQLLCMRRRLDDVGFCVDSHMALTTPPSTGFHLSLTPSVWTS